MTIAKASAAESSPLRWQGAPRWITKQADGQGFACFSIAAYIQNAPAE